MDLMSSLIWRLVMVASKLLDRDEGDAVLGDLLEANETFWRGFLDVLGLVLRRQAAFWKAPVPGWRDSSSRFHAATFWCTFRSR
jgi:hypothetical protein